MSPLHDQEDTPLPPESSPAAPPAPIRVPDLPPLPVFKVGERAEARRPHSLAGTLAENLASGGVRMDKRMFQNMSRGKLVPEARIDLHGMTLDQAHGALNRFVMEGYTRQRRLLLVITGKGRKPSDDGPIPVRHGALRHQVPQWLALPPLGPIVLQVTPAHLRHGGAGAYYVYLRRPRA